ncbi:TolC family protein [Altererythrobacter sp. CAU 1778]
MNTIKLLGGVSVAMLLSACAVTPEPLTPSDLSATAERLQREVAANQEPVAGSIDLYEAMARALKYNLDYKVAMMEEALKAREADLKTYDMLPQLVANAGYAGRANYSGASSLSLISGRQSLEPSTSAEKDIFAADLSLSWDVLDFGLSKIRAEQAADQTLIAEERRRKVAGRVIEEVRTAYWRAVSAQRLLDKLGQLEGSVSETLSNSQRLAERRVSAPLTALTYQRELIDIQGNIRGLQRELVIAKAQLAALMNLEPGTQFELVMPDRGVAMPQVGYSADDMMLSALRNRPELREVAYLQRINTKELDAAALSVLPNLRGFIGLNYDSNDFLYNNDWLNYGARASWNVLNLFRLPAQKRAINAEGDLVRQRELALAMAVMTQVHVARAQLGHRMLELETAQQSNDVQNKILRQIDGGYRAGSMSKQTMLREEMNTLVSEVKYDIAYAEAQNAYANLYAAIGLDSFGPDVTGREDVATLANSLRGLWDRRASAPTVE